MFGCYIFLGQIIHAYFYCIPLGTSSNIKGNYKITSSNSFCHQPEGSTLHIYALYGWHNSRCQQLGKISTLGFIIHVMILQRVRIYKVQFPCMDIRKIRQKFMGIKANPHSIPVVYCAYGISHELYIF